MAPMTGPTGRAGALPTGSASPSAVALASTTPSLVLLSQTPWVVPGHDFDLHLRAAASAGPTADLGITVSVYSCLSSLSGFDQSLESSPSDAPESTTGSALAVSGLTPLPGGGFDLPMPVEVDGSGTTGQTGPFTIDLLPEDQQCRSFPSGVFPVRIQLVDLSTSAVLDSLITHLVYTEAPADTQRLRVAVVLPIQLTQTAAHSPSPTELLARVGTALAAPSEPAVSALTATVDAIATQYPSVPLSLQVSGQTLGLLAGTAHAATLTQLAQLASNPDVHQLTAAPFTPVDATSLVDSGLGGELALQVERGVEAVAAATGRAVPDPTAGLGVWITGDPIDATTVGALSGDGYQEVVLPAADLTSTPANGSTTEPFTLNGAHGTQVSVLASNDDLGARFVSDPGNPVQAAHELAAELAQIYYEGPNGITPRAVVAVAPNSWADDPGFVDALLGSLDGNPMVQAVTVSQAFSLFPTSATCRPDCRLVSVGGGPPLPVGAIRTQRARIDGFADSAPGAHATTQQLGDLVLGGEAQALHPGQQAAVVANAGAALDAQIGQFAIEGNQSVTLTASSGRVPVTIVSTAAYPITTSLELSSDKLLFPNGETTWSTAVTLLPRHTNVVYVPVRTRTSGVFRLDVLLSSPDGSLRLAVGDLSIRSTSSSVVGVILTVGAIAVLAVWWFRTSRKRRALRDADGTEDDSDIQPAEVGAAPVPTGGTGPAP
jgi:hypothetical protein